jgi:predicted enzyme related to lactoylglutathione lyase
MPKHAIVHVELPAKDPAAASRFYGELFGWPITSAPEFNYYMFDTQAGVGGGFTTVGGESGAKPGDVWVYVDTDDIDASLAKAESLGGTTIMPKTEIPGQGWFAFFNDPTGNRVGLWTNAPRPAQG